MPCRKKENRKDAPCVRFAVVTPVVSEEHNFRLVTPGQLNQLCRSTGMQSQSMPDRNLSFDHVGFFGARSSLAI